MKHFNPSINYILESPEGYSPYNCGYSIGAQEEMFKFNI